MVVSTPGRAFMAADLFGALTHPPNAEGKTETKASAGAIARAPANARAPLVVMVGDKAVRIMDRCRGFMTPSLSLTSTRTGRAALGGPARSPAPSGTVRRTGPGS